MSRARSHFLNAQWLAFLGCFALVHNSFALTNITGNLLTEARRLEDFSKTIYGQNSSNYVAASTVEWDNFRQLANTLFSGDLTNAEMQATSLQYETVRFTDTNSGIVLIGARSLETNGFPVRGWGTFFVNTNFMTSALVEAPHPQWDIRTPELAANIFLQSGAHGLLIAGAHRHANGTSTADPCDLTNTIFHAVHVSWGGTNASNTAWQIHGFGIDSHPEFPADTMAVLSTGQNGTNLMSTNLLMLNQEMEARGIKAYAFNRNMASNDLLNIEVNEGVPGDTFTNLGARSNVQGIFSRNLGGTFVHVETRTSLRTNDTWRATTALAVARSISPSTQVPGLFQINVMSAPPNVILSVPTIPARFYSLEQKGNLTSTVWQPIATFTGDGNPRLLTNVSSASAQFFRVKIP